MIHKRTQSTANMSHEEEEEWAPRRCWILMWFWVRFTLSSRPRKMQYQLIVIVIWLNMKEPLLSLCDFMSTESLSLVRQQPQSAVPFRRRKKELKLSPWWRLRTTHKCCEWEISSQRFSQKKLSSSRLRHCEGERHKNWKASHQFVCWDSRKYFPVLFVKILVQIFLFIKHVERYLSSQ